MLYIANYLEDNVVMLELVKNIFQNADFLTIAVTVAIAILGWLVALWLQNKNIKEQHKIQIRYEIYKQFVQIHKETQDSISKLGAYSNPPFILMESSMIPFKLNLTKEYKGVWLPYTEQECVFEGERKWTSFTQELFNQYSDFSNKFLQMMYVTEDWESALEPLLTVKDVLNKEVDLRKQEMHKLLSELQSYTSKHKHDWRNWDKNEVEKIARKVTDNAMSIGMFLSDFMVLIHNELLSTYFGHKRRTRMTLDSEYKVLTKDGIVENVDSDLVNKMAKWKTELTQIVTNELKKDDRTSDDKQRLQSIIDGVCPDCKIDIIIIDSKDISENTCFEYACRHSYVFTNEKTNS